MHIYIQTADITEFVKRMPKTVPDAYSQGVSYAVTDALALL